MYVQLPIQLLHTSLTYELLMISILSDPLVATIFINEV